MKWKTNFQECMQNYCRIETLSGKNKFLCSGCNKHSDQEKRLTIENAPRNLVIHFMRFDPYGWKIGKFVNFPKRFNFRAFISRNIDNNLPKEEQTPYIYDLYGVIVHSGVSVHGGHYYCFVKTTTGQWYYCNDEKVQKVDDINWVLK
jgi:ubiquitin carboxyl-terminal hydrolase 36/42